MEDQNLLYPVFFKLERLRLLVVGAGEVGYEKLSFLLKSSPNARITVVAPWVSPEVQEIIDHRPAYDIQVHQRPFAPTDVLSHDLIIAATNIRELNHEVHRQAKAAGKIINVADTPELCDFYLGSIVTRGQLKVAISTNGKSPTFAKRFRQVMEEILPTETNALLLNLKIIRDRLKGDFTDKVRQLNQLTESLVQRGGAPSETIQNQNK